MAQTLKLTNYSDRNRIDETELTIDVASGSSSLPVSNTNDFDNNYVLLGVIGSKEAELLLASSVTEATAVPLTSNTTLDHQQFDPVYALFGNQIRIYRAANIDGSQPADSEFNYGTPLAAVNIDPNSEVTVYTDPDGGGNYWYKCTYFNESTNAESDLASATAVRGNFTVNYVSLDDVRSEAGFQHAVYIYDDKIDAARQAAQDEVNSALVEFYDVPLQPPINDKLKKIVKQLGAGYLRQAQFSQVSDSRLNGLDMIDWAQLELDKLVLKERDLLDKEGKSLAGSVPTEGANSWPNTSTATTRTHEGGARRAFRMGDVQSDVYATDVNGLYIGNAYYGRKF